MTEDDYTRSDAERVMLFWNRLAGWYRVGGWGWVWMGAGWGVLPRRELSASKPSG